MHGFALPIHGRTSNVSENSIDIIIPHTLVVHICQALTLFSLSPYVSNKTLQLQFLYDTKHTPPAKAESEYLYRHYATQTNSNSILNNVIWKRKSSWIASKRRTYGVTGERTTANQAICKQTDLINANCHPHQSLVFTKKSEFSLFVPCTRGGKAAFVVEPERFKELSPFLSLSFRNIY